MSFEVLDLEGNLKIRQEGSSSLSSLPSIGIPGRDGEDGDSWPISFFPPPPLTKVVDSTATGAQNDWAPSLNGDTLITWHGGSDLAVTGVAGGVTGQLLLFKNTGSAIATFAYNSGSSSAGNKLLNLVTSSLTPVAPGGFIAYQYDGVQWQVVGHDQGVAIAALYNSADYTALVGTWTVDAGDILTFKYHLRGNKLTVDFFFYPTSVSAITSILYLKVPGGFSPNVSFGYSLLMYGQPTWFSGGTITVSVADTRIALYQKDYGGTNWQISTNGTATSGSITFEVY